MALSAGSVTVNHDATYSGSGLALAIFNAYRPIMDGGVNAGLSPDTPVPELGGFSRRAFTYKNSADLLSAIAAGIVSYFHSNADVSPGTLVAFVTTGTSYVPLGTTTVLGSPIGPPPSDVPVPVIGTGSIL